MNNDLSREQWRGVLDDTDPATYGEIVATLEDRDLFDGDADQLVGDAIDDETLVATGDGNFPTYELADDDESPSGAGHDDETPTPQTSETGLQATENDDIPDAWGAADFTDPTPREWPTEWAEAVRWMCRIPEDKHSFAPWGDRNHPDGEEGKDARYKWGLKDNYEDLETALKWDDMNPETDGLAFHLVESENEPWAFVDGDDVRCPDTGEVHPAFIDALERLGVTYADISTSGTGVHAAYKGDLPEGVKTAEWELDEEPWGENDDRPSIEIYDHKHVCIATGDHVPGTPLTVAEWDDDELNDLLDENDQLPDEPLTPGDRVDFDLDDHEPSATEADETTDDIRDIWHAIDRLDARRVADDTIVQQWNDSASTSGGNRAFIPTWGSSSDSGTANIVDDRIWQDTGSRGGYGGPTVMAAIDLGEISDRGAQPSDVKGELWWKAVDHLRDLGYGIPEYEPSDDETTRGRDDPRNVDVVVHAQRAWDAAGLVVPDDLDEDGDDIPLVATHDGDGWKCPECGETVDVVRAAAIATGRIGRCDGDLQGEYHAAYREARERFGAPLPRYLTNEDVTARYDVLIETIRELSFWDLDRDAFTVDVTAEGDDTSTGDAELEIDPTPAFEEHGSWRESESGRSVIVYPEGNIRDYGHPDAGEKGKHIDPLRFVALDKGLILNADDRVEGATFHAAVNAARQEYGAPLPRWENGTPDGHTPLLPDAEELVGAEESDPDDLQETRDAVEALYQEASADPDTPTVLTVPPAGGKTTAAIKNAAGADADGTPTTYLAPRKSLMQQAVEKADEWGATWQPLPVFGGKIEPETLEDALEHVRENGRDVLRDRWQLIGAATDGGELPEIDEDGETDDPEGDEFDDVRPTCPTAEGELGDDWQLAVHVARRIGFSPRDIHADADGIFGAELPCQHDGDCPYSEGWDAVSDPENAPDLLIGHYVHAYVESARTYYERGPDERVKRRPRTVVLDEFPGFDTFGQTFGDEALTHAAWIAGALTDEIEDRHDLLSRDLWSNDFVRKWLDGDATDLDDVADTVEALESRAELLDAAAEADRLLNSAGDQLEHYGLYGPLEDLASGRAAADLETWTEQTADALGAARGQTGGYDWVLEAVNEDVLQPARGSPTHSELLDVAENLDVGGDLQQLVTDAVNDTVGFEYEKRRRLQGARDALKGGDDGARELAVWAKDGWAHPEAHHILRGVITPTGDDSPGDRIRERHGSHDGNGGWGSRDEGTNLTRVENDGTTILVDRNDAGATIYSPPERTSGSGDTAPFVGLDATARRELWELTLGETVRLRDVHADDAEREAFLREQLGLQVVQIGDEARPYEGDPKGKDLDGDVALLDSIRKRYSGVHGARDRDDDTATTGGPAAITTKGVRDVLEDDDRLDDVVAEWENYGNLTGENDLAEHTLAGLLGSPHYGHHTVDFVAALAGEESVPTGRGMALEYGTPVADAYLKHMREDQVMQAILRFTRGDSGALVFARTAALREDLPVVAKGDVARTWSDTATTIAEAVDRTKGGVTVTDLVERDDVDATKRHVRRILSELTDAGYLTREVDRDGVAGEFSPGDAVPETHDVDGLPTAAAPASSDGPGHDSHKVYYTANVRVAAPNSRLAPGLEVPGTVLEAPPDDGLSDPGETTG